MPLPTEELPSRWQKLREAMDRSGFGGLLVYANQLKPAPLHYLTNYTLLGECAFFYLPLAGQSILFISEKWDQERSMVEAKFEEVRILERDWSEKIAAVCKSSEGRLGIIGRELLGRQDIEALEAALGNDTVSATGLLEGLAIIKSPYELSLIREAGKMADAGFVRAIEVVRNGLADYELVAEIDYAMRKLGATDNFQMLAIGRENACMLLPWGKEIEPGDMLLFEITPANGAVTYSAQLCRTAIFSQSPSPLLKEKYALIVEALEESLKAIKPGVPVSEVARIQNEIIGKAGYAEYCRPPYMRTRGHGFGLGSVMVDEDSSLVFREGMSLVIHPNQFIPETSYLALGESIIVTAEDVERLTGTESIIYECWGY